MQFIRTDDTHQRGMHAYLGIYENESKYNVINVYTHFIDAKWLLYPSNTLCNAHKPQNGF